MTQHETWEEVLEAERAYVAARIRVFFAAEDGDEQLRRALQAPSGRGMALRVLRNRPVEQTMEFYRDIFEVTTFAHPQIGLARELLGRMDPGWLSMMLVPLVHQRLTEVEHCDDYWRLGELLDELGQTALLDTVVGQAERSTDEETLAMAQTYREVPSTSPPRLRAR